MAVTDPRRTGDGAGRASTPGGDAGGLLAEVGSLWRALHGVAHDYLVLITLETKRAGLSLAFIVGAGVGIALLLTTAWFGLVAAGVLGLVQAGLAPSLAILAAVAANLIIAFVLYKFFIARKREDLTFPATVRSLRPAASSAQPQAPVARTSSTSKGVH